MSSSGFILRFVDVVLILLFGFISISSIKPSEINPPESTEAPSLPPSQEEEVFVGIRQNGTFAVEGGSKTITSVPALRSYLNSKRDRYEGVPMKVRLRASRVAPMRYLMQAAAICDDLGIQKSIEVEVANSN